MKYNYYTYDNVIGEEYYYFDFEELKNYLSLYLERLNDENEREGETYLYHLDTETDAFEICEVCNIQLSKI
ncbi:hypothetical protein [Staphylococcus capitis]|uniref:hypothetical protein n=1 Tax=Staphylococcus capitis TaxID=29388 RepID=UPI000D1A0EDA|nr:hypothetical protein [Staphylococcus capitis]PTH39460.1 hypothetical protein BU619_08145 [Staphylococcus capitis]